mgnify:CR=1 FL=1
MLTAGARARSGASRRPRSLFALIGQIFALSQGRRDLRNLDDRMLNDIGLSRREADAEADRPFWDAPDHWRR